MKKIIGISVVAALLIWIVAVLLLSQRDSMPVPQPPELAEVPDSPAEAKPAIRYPVPESRDLQAESKPLPSLDESDRSVADVLSGLLGRQQFAKLFRLEDIVRNIVVTIDNIPRQEMAIRQLPVKPVGGAFLTAGSGENLSIAPENAARYTPYIRIAESVNAKKLVAIYVRFYPLFQRAYQELGYPKGYFNDRLVMVIDHLLAAPEIEGKVALVQPHVLYRFADTQLEADSAGHKLMVRMGSENAAKVKAKLREIRRELTGSISQK